MEQSTSFLSSSGSDVGNTGSSSASTTSTSSSALTPHQTMRPSAQPPLVVPSMSDESSILSERQVAALVRSFPSEAARDKGWRQVYSLTKHGASATTLVESCGQHASYVLVVEDSWGYVFGACFSHALTEQKGHTYYGTGESWLFSFHNRSPEQLASYRWTSANELLVLSGPCGFGLAFGGGGGFGLHLDDDLDNGVSNPCATFGNKRLASSEFFKTLNVEVWRLDAALPSGSSSSSSSSHASSSHRTHQQSGGGDRGGCHLLSRVGISGVRRFDSEEESSELEFGDV